jgi:recombinational DNA repair protein RecR
MQGHQLNLDSFAGDVCRRIKEYVGCTIYTKKNRQQIYIIMVHFTKDRSMVICDIIKLPKLH